MCTFTCTPLQQQRLERRSGGKFRESRSRDEGRTPRARTNPEERRGANHRPLKHLVPELLPEPRADCSQTSFDADLGCGCEGDQLRTAPDASARDRCRCHRGVSLTSAASQELGGGSETSVVMSADQSPMEQEPRTPTTPNIYVVNWLI